MTYAASHTGTSSTPIDPHPLDLLAIGETMAMVSPDAGERLDGTATFHVRAGGAESNVAAMLARLGRRTAWASTLGSDPLGDLVLNEVSASGVDVSLVDRDPGLPTGVYFKDTTPNGTSVYYYRTGSAATKMGSGLQRWVAAAPAIVHVSAISAAISAAGETLLSAIVLERAFGNALTSFDVNYRAPLWDLNRAASITLKLAQHSDVVFVGRDEAEVLWGTGTPEAIRRLIDRPGHLVVKDSGDPAVEFAPSGVTQVAPEPRKIVDAVGAGDAFAAGWLAGHLLGVGAFDRLRLAHWVAGEVLGSPFDVADIPTATEALMWAQTES